MKCSKSIPCCPLTSKSTDLFVQNCFGLLSLVKLCIFLLIQARWPFSENVYRQRTRILARNSSLKLNFLMMDFSYKHATFLLHKMLTDEVVCITCGLWWCFNKQFRLSFWRHPFTAEDPLVLFWLVAEQRNGKSSLMRKSQRDHKKIMHDLFCIILIIVIYL